jgi:hypothetical protein
MPIGPEAPLINIFSNPMPPSASMGLTYGSTHIVIPANLGDADDPKQGSGQDRGGAVDTAVMVLLFSGDHVRHRPVWGSLFIQFDKSAGFLGSAQLAEVYFTLTRTPGKHSIRGKQALLLIGSIASSSPSSR